MLFDTPVFYNELGKYFHSMFLVEALTTVTVVEIPALQ